MIPCCQVASRRRRHYRLASLAAFLLVAATMSVSAHAEDAATADALFQAGKDLMGEKKFAEACSKFEASLKLDHAVGTLMNLADCHEQLGALSRAWTEWGEAESMAQRASDAERADLAKRRRAQVDARLPKVTIKVTGTATGFALWRDGVELDPAVYGVAVPVDPGAHVVQVRRDKKVVKEEKVDAAEGARLDVAINLDELVEANKHPAGSGTGGSRVVPSPGNGPGSGGSKSPGATCEATAECTKGYVCLNGTCEEEKSGDEGRGSEGESSYDKLRKNWISVGVQIDLMALDSTTNVCGAYSVTNDGTRLKLKQVGDAYDNYFCYYPDGGGEYLGAPRENIDNEIQGGMGFAGVRILAGYDRVFWKGLVGGVRLGYAIDGQPDPGNPKSNGLLRQSSAASYLPVHFELRLAYYRLAGAVEDNFTNGLRPYGFIASGVANMATGVSVSVCDQLSKDTGEQIATSGERSCKNQTGTKRTLDAYQVAGNGFVGLGGGLQWAFIDNFGVTIESKLMFMYPTFGFALATTISPVVMF